MNSINNYPALIKEAVIDKNGNIHCVCFERHRPTARKSPSLIYLKYDSNYVLISEVTLDGHMSSEVFIDVNKHGEAFILWKHYQSAHYLAFIDSAGRLQDIYNGGRGRYFNLSRFTYTFDNEENLLILCMTPEPEIIRFSPDGSIESRKPLKNLPNPMAFPLSSFLNEETLVVVNNAEYQRPEEIREHKNYFNTNKIIYFTLNIQSGESSELFAIESDDFRSRKIPEIDIPWHYISSHAKRGLEIKKFGNELLILSKTSKSGKLFLFRINEKGEVIKGEHDIKLKKYVNDNPNFKIRFVPIFLENRSPTDGIQLFGISNDLRVYYKFDSSFKQDIYPKPH